MPEGESPDGPLALRGTNELIDELKARSDSLAVLYRPKANPETMVYSYNGEWLDVLFMLIDAGRDLIKKMDEAESDEED